MNLEAAVTYVGVDGFCIFMAIAMALCIKSDFGSEYEVKMIRRSLTAYVCFMLFGLVWTFLQYTHNITVLSVALLANALSLMSMTLTSYFWFLFSISRIKRTENFLPGNSARFVRLPCIIVAVLCLTTPITGLVYKISEQGTVHKGPLFVFVTLLQCLYSVSVFGYALWVGTHEKSKSHRHFCRLFGMYTLFPVVVGIVKLSVGDTPILSVAIIMPVFVIFINVQASQINTDSLTGLHNRNYIDSLLRNSIARSSKSRRVTFYILDVNRFKQINDNYGHSQGDVALTIIAECLFVLTEEYHVFVGRYGGDEFAIVDSGARFNDPLAIKNRMNELLKEKHKQKGLPYPLSVCMGYAAGDLSNSNGEELVLRADRMLYDEKSKIR